jgi:hypothetical protein
MQWNAVNWLRFAWSCDNLNIFLFRIMCYLLITWQTSALKCECFVSKMRLTSFSSSWKE